MKKISLNLSFFVVLFCCSYSFANWNGPQRCHLVTSQLAIDIGTKADSVMKRFDKHKQVETERIGVLSWIMDKLLFRWSADTIQVYLNEKKWPSQYFEEQVVIAAENFANVVKFQIAIDKKLERANAVKNEINEMQSTMEKGGFNEHEKSRLQYQMGILNKSAAALEMEAKTIREKLNTEYALSLDKINEDLKEYSTLNERLDKRVDEVATWVARAYFLKKLYKQVKKENLVLEKEPIEIELPTIQEREVSFNEKEHYSNKHDLFLDYSKYNEKAWGEFFLWRNLGFGLSKKEIKKINNQQVHLFYRLRIYRDVLNDYRVDGYLQKEQKKILVEISNTLRDLDLQPGRRALARVQRALWMKEVKQLFRFTKEEINKFSERVGDVVDSTALDQAKENLGIRALSRFFSARFKMLALSSIFTAGSFFVGGEHAVNFFTDSYTATTKAITRTGYRLFGSAKSRQRIIETLAVTRDESKYRQGVLDFTDAFLTPVFKKIFDLETKLKKDPENIELKEKLAKAKNEYIEVIDNLVWLQRERTAYKDLRSLEQEFFNIISGSGDILKTADIFTTKLIESMDFNLGQRVHFVSELLREAGKQISKEDLLKIRDNKDFIELHAQRDGNFKTYLKLYYFYEQNLDLYKESGELQRRILGDYLIDTVAPTQDILKKLDVDLLNDFIKGEQLKTQ